MKERISEEKVRRWIEQEAQVRIIASFKTIQDERDALAAQVEKAEGASLLAIKGAKDLSVSMAALLDERKALKEELEKLRGELAEARQIEEAFDTLVHLVRGESPSLLNDESVDAVEVDFAYEQLLATRARRAGKNDD